MNRAAPLAALLAAMLLGCSSPGRRDAGAPAEREGAQLAAAADVSGLPEEWRGLVRKTFTGDLDGMIKRRVIRAGVPFNRTFYFVDKGVQRGLSYEYLMLFEDKLNARLNSGNLRVHVVLLPMARDALLPALRAGQLDMVAAQLTVTPERQAIVDFSDPTRRNIDEVVVTAPGVVAPPSLDGLAGTRVFVRESSSYYASLKALNRRLSSEGRAPVRIELAPETLEDDDLLEMINAGLVPATVVDNYLAEYWKRVFPGLNVHEDLAVRSGGNLAVAFRKASPRLAAAINAFIAENGLNSAIGRTLEKRYLQSTAYVTDAASQAQRRKFVEMAGLFRKYGDQYDFDYLLMAAQGYQESHLDQNARSHVGAIGVMQVMPATGAEQQVGDIHQLEPNIHAGVKYMRFMRDRYFEGEAMDALNKGLFTFASYNAGAGRIHQLRQEAAQRGLNPNLWFGNVERVASERIGRETVTYVANIYKYYIAYRLIVADRARRRAAKAALTHGTSPSGAPPEKPPRKSETGPMVHG